MAAGRMIREIAIDAFALYLIVSATTVAEVDLVLVLGLLDNSTSRGRALFHAESDKPEAIWRACNN